MFKDFTFYGGRFVIGCILIYGVYAALIEAPREKTIEICDTIENYFSVYEALPWSAYTENGLKIDDNYTFDIDAFLAEIEEETDRLESLKKMVREAPENMVTAEYENKEQVEVAMKYISLEHNYRELRKLCSRDWTASFEEHVEKAYSIMSAGKELSITKLPKSDNSEP